MTNETTTGFRFGHTRWILSAVCGAALALSSGVAHGGDTYCTGYGGAAGGPVANVGATAFRVSRPIAAVCP